MQSIDLNTRLSGKRRRLQKGVEWACRGAIAITAVLMLVFFATLGYRGVGAFTQTKIDLTVTQIESSTKKTINEALYDIGEGYVGEMNRTGKKNLRGLVTPNAYSTIDITEPGTYTLVAHTDVDMYVKGVYDKLSDAQRNIVDAELERGTIYRTWNWDFWTNSDSRSPEIAGIWGAVVGTVYTIGLAILFAFPIGVGCATYMEEFPKRKAAVFKWYDDFMEININNLAAVPSIVYGLLGLAVLINFFGMPRSASLVGAITLGILVLPVIVISARTALRTVPQAIRDASNGLGASRLQTTVYQVLPAALPGIITGTIIGIARAIGESAPLLMIGMVAFILVPPSSVLDSATTLPVQIFLWADSPERGFAEKTSAAILVLLVALVALNLLAIWLRKRFEIKW
jgi:phosphate transport system permease protein